MKTHTLPGSGVPSFTLRKTFSSPFNDYTYQIMDANDDGVVDIGTHNYLPTNQFNYHNIIATPADTFISKIITEKMDKWKKCRYICYITNKTGLSKQLHTRNF